MISKAHDIDHSKLHLFNQSTNLSIEIVIFVINRYIEIDLPTSTFIIDLRLILYSYFINFSDNKQNSNNNNTNKRINETTYIYIL